jgi:hypothetical protein
VCYGWLVHSLPALPLSACLPACLPACPPLICNQIKISGLPHLSYSYACATAIKKPHLCSNTRYATTTAMAAAAPPPTTTHHTWTRVGGVYEIKSQGGGGFSSAYYTVIKHISAKVKNPLRENKIMYAMTCHAHNTPPTYES